MPGEALSLKTTLAIGKLTLKAGASAWKGGKGILRQRRILRGETSRAEFLEDVWEDVRGLLTDHGRRKGFINSFKSSAYRAAIAPSEFKVKSIQAWIGAEDTKKNFLTLLRADLDIPKRKDISQEEAKEELKKHDQAPTAPDADPDQIIDAVIGLARYFVHVQISDGERLILETLASPRLELIASISETLSDKPTPAALRKRDAALTDLACIDAETIRHNRPIRLGTLEEHLGDDFPVNFLSWESKQPIPPKIFNVPLEEVDQILAENNIQQLAPGEFLQELEDGGLCLCQAPGGQGKSFMLVRLAILAAERGWVTIFIQLGVNKSQLEQAPREAGGQISEQALFAPLNISSPKFSDGHFDGQRSYLILVDGLNEISRGAAEACMWRFKDWVNGRQNVHVIVMDRMMGREAGAFAVKQQLSLSRVSKCEILRQFPEGEVRDHLAGNPESLKLLSRPIFLDWARHMAKSSPQDLEFRGRADILEYFLATALRSFLPDGSSPRQVIEEGDGLFAAIAREVSRVACRMYERHPGRSFPKRAWDKEGKPVEAAGRTIKWRNITDSLDHARVLWLDSKSAQLSFQHQLIHDFLVARDLADRGSRSNVAASPGWGYQLLNAVTWNAENLDPIRLAAERLAWLERMSDDYVLGIYDFHWPAALGCAKTLYRAKDNAGRRLISDFLASALAAVIACRIGDVFSGSLSFVEKELRDFDAGLPRDIGLLVHRASRPKTREIADQCHPMPHLRDLFELVRKGINQLDADPIDRATRQDWISAFRFDKTLDPAEVNQMLHDNPLVGWTAANVVRLRILYLGISENRKTDFLERCIEEHRKNYDQGAEHETEEGNRRMVKRRRMLYALGVAQSEEVTELLTEVSFAQKFVKEHHLARSDAFRSVIEVAARTPARHPMVFDALRYNVGAEYDSYPHYWRRLRKVFYRVRPSFVQDFPGWCEGMTNVLSTGCERATKSGNDEERDEWNKAIEVLNKDLVDFEKGERSGI